MHGNGANVGWPIVQQEGVGNDGFDHDTRRQKITANIADVAASGLMRKGAARILLRLHTQGLVAQHLQVHQTVAKRREGHSQKEGHPTQATMLSFPHHGN